MTDTLTKDWKSKLTNGKAVYLFDEGDAKMRDILGGKGANLAEMTRLGFPVPPGFTVTTEVCNVYLNAGNKFPADMQDELKTAMAAIEKKMGKGFGDRKNPLLVSVRSGAKFSMPGMMDTVLNLGLNDETVQGLIEQSGDERFAYDAYRRFIMMFSDVVMGLSKHDFDKLLQKKKKELNITEDSLIPAAALKQLVDEFKAKFKAEANRDFPTDVFEQLSLSVEAVFRSWRNPRAMVYRDKEKIAHDLGTAVNVQSMVFGNMGDDCGTGVAFTRDYNSGAKVPVGDYLTNAQGEDVVAGIRTPKPLEALASEAPEMWKQLLEVSKNLELHFKEMQDMEFTIEKGKLYMLQTRTGKRTAQAAIKIASDMVEEKLISREDAVLRVAPGQLDQLLHPSIPAEAKKAAHAAGRYLAKGTGAAPGAACGKVVFEANDAVEEAAKGHPVILVRPETTPDDAHGMAVAKGILTSTGGPSSHAALVARGWGIPCIVGCEALRIDLDKKKVTVNDQTFGEGEWLTFDGGTGEVYLGHTQLQEASELTAETKLLLGWADEFRKLGVYANADTPKDAERSRAFGATGVGLCRTEHMFMERDRLPIVQEMILSAPKAEALHRQELRAHKELSEQVEGTRRHSDAKAALDEAIARKAGPWKIYTDCLARLLPIQREDFHGILKAMAGHWVIIRLLDPPLHEFLPAHSELLVDVARLRTVRDHAPDSYNKVLEEVRHRREDRNATLESLEEMLHRVESMKEFNPMLGLRVCRLGIVYPEIYKMQVQAIFEAACDLVKAGIDARPEVMIPGVGTVEEMRFTRNLVETVARQVQEKRGIQVKHKIGTMIELPRATVVAGDLAKNADFFSFGTNDLTQTTLGYSRDDAAGTFIPVYLEEKILKNDPFQVIDTVGVGRLMKLAVEEGRAANPQLEVGICGEHGGEPESVAFCHTLGLDYVSCSPFRVPIARLAAAHAALASKAGFKDK
ncbi:MAG: pyruvate, phosphate dikinase [Candidatus Eremiobacteraeota bacterium]|nr:pyruvate, phosphate dikinase [Candidatus Eremiobacteraeota bacterium]